MARANVKHDTSYHDIYPVLGQLHFRHFRKVFSFSIGHEAYA